MPLTTPLNVSPYFEDFSVSKDYYQILFKPSVAVQARELNNLQATLQNQIEQFGDNILQAGTIVNGCNFNFNTNIAYVKLIDTQGDGNAVEVGNYNNYYATGSITGLTAYIVNTVPGFVSSDPDLNTLYVNYTSGNTSANTFVPNETLTITDSNNAIWQVNIINGSSGFSNTDSLVFVPAITVANSTGGSGFVNTSGNFVSFTVGQTIKGATSNASAIITEVNNTINSTSLVLKVQPITANLSFVPANTNSWTFLPGENISVANGVQSANITAIIGENASGTLTTDAFGALVNTSISDQGTGYYAPPFVTVISPTGSYNNLSLVGQNYIATVNVASTANPTGFGYSFGVSNGVIYQKGFFSRVVQQNIIVSKYNNVPDGVSVGFTTVESIANSSIDNSLFDNAIGSPNETAPGADRLELTPTLFVSNTANSIVNNEFFSIVDFNNGNPYIQRQTTQYNAIEDEIATREFETSGNFIYQPFNLTTQSPSTQNNESFGFNAVISPGAGFLNGYNINTSSVFTIGVNKGVNTSVSNSTLTINYGNYIRINNMAGMFQFNTGDLITLYDTASGFLNTAAKYSGALAAPSGNIIGTARIRSMIYEGGADAGTPSTIYRLYLFDIQINSGKNFALTRSVYYNNVLNAVADIVTDTSATTSQPICTLHNPTSAMNQLVVLTTASVAMVSANNIQYSYRTLRSSNCNTSGIITMTLTNPGESFPYSGGSSLLPTQEEDLIIVPTANIVASTTSTGTLSCNTTSNILIGSGTSFTTLTSGDYIQINTAGGSTIRRVSNISNATFMTVDSNLSFTNTTSTFSTVLPQNIPIPLATRIYRSANVNGGSTTLTVNLGNTYTSNTLINMAFNVNVANAQPIAKTSTRSVFVRIQSNTNIGNTTGPWLLGIPDIYRLRGVWLGSNNTFDNTTGLNVTGNFFIDHNQNQDYYDLGNLYISPTSKYTVPSNGVLLVELDAFTAATGTGFGFDVQSYNLNDTMTFPQLVNSTFVNTLEIPEFYTSSGGYYDLRDVFDFRPRVVNSAIYSLNAASATINPTYPSANVAFGNTTNIANDKKFPVPQSGLNATIQRYIGRTDLVVINGNSNFQVITGYPGQQNKLPIQPTSTMPISYMRIPAYPSLPQVFSTNLSLIADKGIASNKFTYKRMAKYAISEPTATSGITLSQPAGYNMAQIGALDARISNLEYYMGLTLQQQAIASAVIPSNNIPTQNRYKFGFFVDDFSTTNYSDTTDPEYNATIVNNQLTVKSNQLNIEFDYAVQQPSKVAVLPYTPYSILQQNFATVPANTLTPLPPPTYNGYMVAEPEYFSVIAQITTSGNGAGGITSAGTPWTSTTSFTIQNGILNQFASGSLSSGSSFQNLQEATGTQVVNYGNNSVDTSAANYGPQVAQALQLGFRGSVNPTNATQYVSGDRIFLFTITELRANTVHKFYYAGSDQSNACRQIATTTGVDTSVGSPLVSKPDGTLNIEFYYTSPITAELANSSIQWSNALVYRSYMSKLSGLQTVAVASADGLSTSSTTVDAIGLYGPNGGVPWFIDNPSANGQVYSPDFNQESAF